MLWIPLQLKWLKHSQKNRNLGQTMRIGPLLQANSKILYFPFSNHSKVAESPRTLSIANPLRLKVRKK